MFTNTQLAQTLINVYHFQRISKLLNCGLKYTFYEYSGNSEQKGGTFHLLYTVKKNWNFTIPDLG